MEENKNDTVRVSETTEALIAPTLAIKHSSSERLQTNNGGV